MKHKIINCFRYPELFRTYYTNDYSYSNKITYLFSINSTTNEDEDVEIYLSPFNVKKKIFGIQEKEDCISYYLDDI